MLVKIALLINHKKDSVANDNENPKEALE